MDTKKLAALIETVRYESINKAAQELGYTQSGLTYILKTLEDELGVQILDRSHKGVFLTREGRELYPYFEAIINTEDELYTKIINMGASITKNQTVLRIGVYPSVLTNYLTSELVEFNKQYKNICFDVHVGVKNLPAWLDEGTIDIAILEKGLASGYQWTFFMEDEFSAVFREDSPLAQADEITLEMLTDYNFIFPTLNEKNAVLMEIKRKGIVFPNQTFFRVEDGSVMFTLVKKGMGVTFLNNQYAAECPPGVIMRPFTPRIKRSLGVVSNPKRTNSKAADLFKNWLVDRAGW